MNELEGTVALVTGGGSGIGLAAAELMAARGASLLLVDRDAPALEQAVAKLREGGRPIIGVVADILDSEALDRAVETAVREFGGLSAVVTAAGIQRYGDVVSTTIDTWDEVMAVNVTGAFRTVKSALPHLRKSGGSVVLVSSVQAFVAQGNAAAYVTSKGALNSFARAVAIDEARFGVRANAVCPGSVDTPMLRASARQFSDGSEEGEAGLLDEWARMHPLGRIAQSHEVGEAISFLVSDRSSFITGTALTVDGGLTASVAVAVTS